MIGSLNFDDCVPETGYVGILNVGAGDTKLTFDPERPDDRERAAQVVTDMLRRGYAIFVEVGTQDGKLLYQRAETFDPETCEYIIVGTPHADESTTEKKERRASGAPRQRVKAETTRATAVARSAGG